MRRAAIFPAAWSDRARSRGIPDPTFDWDLVATLHWIERHKIIAASIAAVLYFGAAAWMQLSYVDPTPKGRIVIRLSRSFERFGYTNVSHDASQLSTDADEESIEGDARSLVVIYEDGKQLGPAHSNFSDIRDIGAGRFAVWRTQGLVFSASDNTNPRTNGRRYWAVVP